MIANGITKHLTNESINISFENPNDDILYYLELLVKYQTNYLNKNSDNLINLSSSVSIIDILENAGVNIETIPERSIIGLLELQLSIFQSCLIQDTTMQQIEILETLLDSYYTNTSNYTIQRCISLIDLAKLVRIIENSSLSDDINGCND